MTRNLRFFRCGASLDCVPARGAAHRRFGEEVFGGVGGVTRDSTSKQPVAQVRITAHNVNKGTDRTCHQRFRWNFHDARLEPGRYQVEAAREWIRPDPAPTSRFFRQRRTS